MKKVTIYLLTLFCFSIPFSSKAFSKEKDSGFVIVDKDCWKQSWVEENGEWKLTTLFDKAMIFTYFNKPPNKSTFLGFSKNNKPIRQEIIFVESNTPIVLKYCQYEEFGDGSLCWSFKYEKEFIKNGQRFYGITTALIDDPINGKNEYRYSIWK